MASGAVQAAGDRQRQIAASSAGQGFGGTLLTGAQGASKPATTKETLGS